jgi:hypothetical protein
MLPFERLRYLARSSGDERALVHETAACLADFDDDPAQLVLVCRRLLAHHPTNGPLWWLCARVVGAADPASAAREAMRVIERDRTADRLATVLPFPHDLPIAVLGWPETVAAALAQRPDLDVVVVRPRRSDPGMRARLGNAGRGVRMMDEAEAMASGATHLLVEVLVTSPARALVPDGTGDLRSALGSAHCWLVAPIDRILPDRLFVALAQRRPQDGVEELPLATADRVAGPGGLETPERLAARLDCPIAPELLRG